MLCLPDDAAREAVGAGRGAGQRRTEIARRQHRAPGRSRMDLRLSGDGARSARQDRDVAQSQPIPAATRPALSACCARSSKRGSSRPTTRSRSSAVSGYSGGGRSMIEAHDRDGGPAFELYALGLEHKHVPEIELFAGLSRRPIFMPSVGHFRQGMLVSIPLYLDDLPGRPTGADLREALRAFYEGSEHVTVAVGNGQEQARTGGAQWDRPARSLRLGQRGAPPCRARRPARQSRQRSVGRGGAEFAADAGSRPWAQTDRRKLKTRPARSCLRSAPRRVAGCRSGPA